MCFNPAFLFSALFLAVLTPVVADIVYDPMAKAVHVRLFPESWPCTPARLLAMDRAGGWGIMKYDKAADTYRLAADLVVGANDGSDTFFQLGSREHPRETLVVDGNVRVHAYFVQGENPGSWWTAQRAVNRLTIGVAGDPGVRAALKIVSEPDNTRVLTIGAGGFGGQLCVYNSLITSAIQDVDHQIASADGKQRIVMNGDRIVLRHATMSWIAGMMTYAAATQGDGKIFVCEDTRFEHGGTALIDAGANATIRRCVFSNLQTAVQDWGSLDMVLVDCVFENNRRNWALIYTDHGLTCIDCQFGDPLKCGLYRSRTDSKTGEIRRPKFKSRRHVVVEVVDATGRIVTNAVVEATCNQLDRDAVDYGRQTVNAEGRTPGRGESNAMLLTDILIQGTDDIRVPDVREYFYTISAAASGGGIVGHVAMFRPTNSWEVIRIKVDESKPLK